MMNSRKEFFEINHSPVLVFSGEIHYFRIPKSEWEDRIIKAQQAGLNTIASYIPWMYHEYREGVFDFSGRSEERRDVLSFIDLAAKHGLQFIARIGPVCNGEMLYEGLPGWLMSDYPEVFLPESRKSAIHHKNVPSYHSLVFLSKVLNWYEQVIPELVRRQHPSGNIILFQLCNEIGMINWVNRIADYTETSENMYRDFIIAKYRDLTTVNRVYGTEYASISELGQPLSQVEGRFIRYLDWADYYRDYYGRYYGILAEKARDLGVSTKLLANIPQFYDYDVRGRGIYSPLTTSRFRCFRHYTRGVVFGGAYQMRRLDYENFHDILVASEHIRMITEPGMPSICAELQTGVLSDKPRIYPPDIELNVKTSVMSGLDGINCYMFAGGANDRLAGQFGRYHEWQAPIASDGTLRSHYEPLKRFGRFNRTFGSELSGCEKVNEVTIGFYEPYYKTEYIEGPLVDSLFEKRNSYYYDGLIRLTQLSGYNFNMVDIDAADLAGIEVLAVDSILFMASEVQKKLLEYVAGGGKLLLCGTIDLMDMNMERCGELAESLGLRCSTNPGVRTAYLYGQEVYLDNQQVDTFSGLLPDDRVISESNGCPSGFFRHHGKGVICVLGFHLLDKFSYYIELTDRIYRELGVRKSVCTTGHDVVSILRKKEDSGFLYLANFHDDMVSDSISVNLFKEPIEFDLALRPRCGIIVPLNHDLPHFGKILFSTCEILEITQDESSLTIQVYCVSTELNAIRFRGISIREASVKSGRVQREVNGDYATVTFTCCGLREDTLTLDVQRIN